MLATDNESVLDIQVRLRHPSGYGRLLNQHELSSGLVTTVMTTVTNVAKTGFSGGTLEIAFREHGTSIATGSLSFSLTTPAVVKPLQAGETFVYETTYEPTLPGLSELVFTVTQGDTKVLLSGYRSSQRPEHKQYFRIVDRHLIEMTKELRRLQSDKGGI